MNHLIGISGKNTVALIWQYLYDYYYYNYKHPITVEDFKEYVKNNHHLKCVWIQKSFANKLKQITCILLECTMEQLEDPIFKETPLGEEWWVIKLPSSEIIPYLGDYPPFYKKYDVIKLTPRLLLQLLGTDCGRKIINPDIWVNATFANFSDKEEWFRKETGLTRTEYLTKNGHSNEYKTLNKQFFKSLPNWIISDVRFFNEAKAIKDREGILIRVERDSDPKDSHVSENELNNYKDWNYVIDNNYSLSELILKVRQIMFKEGIIYE